MQTISKPVPDKDRFSIINIFAGRHAKKPSPKKEISSHRSHLKEDKKSIEVLTDQDIDDEIYSEDFEKASRSRISTDKDIIEEDFGTSG